jgi:hypothetical protein
LRSLTTEYSLHIVGARAQLAGHAVAIYGDDCGRLWQHGELLLQGFSSSLLSAERVEECLRGIVTRRALRDSVCQPLLPTSPFGNRALQHRSPVCGLSRSLGQANERLRHGSLHELRIESKNHGVQYCLVQDGLWEMQVVRTDGRPRFQLWAEP